MLPLLPPNGRTPMRSNPWLHFCPDNVIPAMGPDDLIASAIYLALSMVTHHGWHAKQFNYLLTFPQTPAVRPMFMESPRDVTYLITIQRTGYPMFLRTYMEERTYLVPVP